MSLYWPNCANLLSQKHIRWASFDHPSVLPLLGVIKDFNDKGTALVAPYLANGTAMSFIRNNPGADRLKLVSLKERNI